MNLKFNIIILVLYSTLLLSQNKSDWEKVDKNEVVNAYQKACNWFSNTSSYSFNMTYTSYKDHYSKEVIETSNGFYKRSTNKFKSEIMGIRTIQNSSVRVVVDSADKLIAITDPGSLTPTMAGTDQLLEMLSNVKALKKKKSNYDVTYKIDFSKNELFESYEFSVDNNGLLEKLIYYYSEQDDKDFGGDTDDGHFPITSKIKPRLEILFSKYQYPIKVSSNDFEIKGILLAENRKVTLNESYKSYSVKDYRTIKK